MFTKTDQKKRPISNPSYSFHTLTLCNCQCTNHFNIILCHGLYIFIETITVFTKTYKKPISNHPYSVYTLTCCTFIKISASQRVLVYAVNIYIYIYGGVEVWLHSFFSSGLNGGEW